jgi:hypothetical protein
LGGCADRGPLAPIPRMPAAHHALALQAGQNLPGLVCAAVVDNDKLHIAGIVDVEHRLDGFA